MEPFFNFLHALHDIPEIKHTPTGQKKFLIGLPRSDLLIQTSILSTVLMNPQVAPIRTKSHGATTMLFTCMEPPSCIISPLTLHGNHELKAYYRPLVTSSHRKVSCTNWHARQSTPATMINIHSKPISHASCGQRLKWHPSPRTQSRHILQNQHQQQQVFVLGMRMLVVQNGIQGHSME